MCNGDNEAAAMEQEWAQMQARREYNFQAAYERYIERQMELRSYVIEPVSIDNEEE